MNSKKNIEKDLKDADDDNGLDVRISLKGKRFRIRAEGFIRKGFGLALVGTASYFIVTWLTRILVALLEMGRD